MIEPCRSQYFGWLCEQIWINYGRSGKTFWEMLTCLYHKQFVWVVANDDNRIEDGRDLRLEFLHEIGEDPTPMDRREACSVLELLVGLSRRCAFATDGNAPRWAWLLIENLEFHKFSDSLSLAKIEVLNERLDALIWRQYQPDGSGGFFPLGFPEKDQREVELWYQMSAYLEEQQDL